MQQFSLVDGGDGIQPKEGFESGSQREARPYLLLVKGNIQNADESKSWMLKCYLLGVEKCFMSTFITGFYGFPGPHQPLCEGVGEHGSQ